MNPIIPRIAAIHDLAGFGRCSLTVIIPVLSAMGFQVCPVPTALLSTHTSEFEGFHFRDLTPDMQAVMEHWKSLRIDFAGIYSGFLGSSRQIEIVRDFIKSFRQSGTGQVVLVDPVLGDDGKLYSTMDEAMVNGMRSLVCEADVITPNMTEAAFLLNKPYKTSIEAGEIRQWAVELAAKGPESVILTSVPLQGAGDEIVVVVYEKSKNRFLKAKVRKLPAYFPGTGDIFSSVVLGSLLQGNQATLSAARAVSFVDQAVNQSFVASYPLREGVLLERMLPLLNNQTDCCFMEPF